VLAVIGLTSTAGLTAGVLRAGGGRRSNGWPFLLLVITACYGYQTSTAFTASSRLWHGRTPRRSFSSSSGPASGRALELLGLRGAVLLDLPW
jgi:hypothetical protein